MLTHDAERVDAAYVIVTYSLYLVLQRWWVVVLGALVWVALVTLFAADAAADTLIGVAALPSIVLGWVLGAVVVKLRMLARARTPRAWVFADVILVLVLVATFFGVTETIAATRFPVGVVRSCVLFDGALVFAYYWTRTARRVHIVGWGSLALYDRLVAHWLVGATYVFVHFAVPYATGTITALVAVTTLATAHVVAYAYIVRTAERAHVRLD